MKKGPAACVSLPPPKRLAAYLVVALGDDLVDCAEDPLLCDLVDVHFSDSLSDPLVHCVTSFSVLLCTNAHFFAFCSLQMRTSVL